LSILDIGLVSPSLELRRLIGISLLSLLDLLSSNWTSLAWRHGLTYSIGYSKRLYSRPSSYSLKSVANYTIEAISRYTLIVLYYIVILVVFEVLVI